MSVQALGLVLLILFTIIVQNYTMCVFVLKVINTMKHTLLDIRRPIPILTKMKNVHLVVISDRDERATSREFLKGQKLALCKRFFTTC